MWEAPYLEDKQEKQVLFGKTACFFWLYKSNKKDIKMTKIYWKINVNSLNRNRGNVLE